MAEIGESEEIVIAQPWFSAPGHPASALNRFSLGLERLGLSHRVVVYSVSQLNTEWQSSILSSLNATVLPSRKILHLLLGTLAAGTAEIFLYLLRTKNRSRRVLFLDANLYVLSFMNLIFKCEFGQLITVALKGPDFYKRGLIGRIIKWPLVKAYMNDKRSMLAVRTPELKRAWIDEFSSFQKKIVVLEHLDLISAEPSPAGLRETTRRSRFIVGGQIRPEKNISGILKSFRKLEGKSTLKIVGKCNCRELEKEFKSASSNVEIINSFVDDADLMSSFRWADYHLMLYSSWDKRTESAMLYHTVKSGCPVIAFSGGWLHRIIVEHNLGWIIAPLEERALELSIEEILARPQEEYERCQISIREFCNQFASNDRMKEILTILKWRNE